MKVAIIGTGDMGSAVAVSLASQSISTLTCLNDRSEQSRNLARTAGMTNVDSLESLAEKADMFLSIMPPSAALRFAKRFCPVIAASERKLLFVD